MVRFVFAHVFVLFSVVIVWYPLLAAHAMQKRRRRRVLPTYPALSSFIKTKKNW